MTKQPNLIDTPVVTTLNDRIKAVNREVGLRKRVYPKWIAAGKMSQQQADFQIKCMEDVAEMLMRLQHVMDV